MQREQLTSRRVLCEGSRKAASEGLTPNAATSNRSQEATKPPNLAPTASPVASVSQRSKGTLEIASRLPRKPGWQLLANLDETSSTYTVCCPVTGEFANL